MQKLLLGHDTELKSPPCGVSRVLGVLHPDVDAIAADGSAASPIRDIRSVAVPRRSERDRYVACIV
jgi:hypothetical protein